MPRKQPWDHGLELVDEARTELLKHKGQWGRLSRMSGLCPKWIEAFREGRIKDPGIVRLVWLCRFFGWEIKIVKSRKLHHFNRSPEDVRRDY